MQRFVTELLSPSQIGPAITRMSAANTCSWITGHSSVGRPVLGHVGPDSGRHVVIDEPKTLGRNAVSLHQRTARINECLRVRDLRRWLQRAIDEQRAQAGEIPCVLGHGNDRPGTRVTVTRARSANGRTAAAHDQPEPAELEHVLAQDLAWLTVADVVVERPAGVRDLPRSVGSTRCGDERALRAGACALRARAGCRAATPSRMHRCMCSVRDDRG